MSKVLPAEPQSLHQLTQPCPCSPGFQFPSSASSRKISLSPFPPGLCPGWPGLLLVLTDAHASCSVKILPTLAWQWIQEQGPCLFISSPDSWLQTQGQAHNRNTINLCCLQRHMVGPKCPWVSKSVAWASYLSSPPCGRVEGASSGKEPCSIRSSFDLIS